MARTGEPHGESATWSAEVGRGERVYLRRALAADRDEYTAVTERSAALHRPWITPAAAVAGGLDPMGFDRWRGDPLDDRRRAWFICRNEDDAIAGGAALSEIVRGDFQSAYLGYWVGAPHHGRGYMTEGLGLLLDHAFGPLGLHRVEANVQPGNERSIALAKRLGFRLEGLSERYLRINGEWRDHERWAITVEEWR